MGNQVPGWKMKERSRELTKLRFEIGRSINHPLLGSRLRVITTEEGKPGTTLARSDDYRPVVIRGRVPLGDFVEVLVEDSTETYLLGKSLDGSGGESSSLSDATAST